MSQDAQNTCKQAVLLTQSSTSMIRVPHSIHNVNNFDIQAFKSHFPCVDSVKRYCTWQMPDCCISIFGSKQASDEPVNQHDLPPPEDVDLFFGNILVVRSASDGTILNCSQEDYTDFIEKAFGGFETLGSEDSSESDDERNDTYSLNSFVVDDNAAIEMCTSEEEEDEESTFVSEEEDDSDFEPDQEDEDEEEHHNGTDSPKQSTLGSSSTSMPVQLRRSNRIRLNSLDRDE